jgi:hypothetical protein
LFRKKLSNCSHSTHYPVIQVSGPASPLRYPGLITKVHSTVHFDIACNVVNDKIKQYAATPKHVDRNDENHIIITMNAKYDCLWIRFRI